MTEAAYSIVEINDSKVFVLQAPRAKRFNPLKETNLGSMAISHICDEGVADEPPHTNFRLPSSIKYLISHNIDFDITVLKNAGVTHEPKLICTNAMANFLIPTLGSHKLVSLLYHFHRDVARIPTHLSFGKHKGEVIADLAASSEDAGYIRWLLIKQDSVDLYLAQACQQVLVSV